VQFGQKIQYILYISDISWIGKNRMELLHKLAILAVVAGVVGIITVPPVLADDDDDDDDDDKKNWGKKKQSDNQVALIKRTVSFELCGSLSDTPNCKRLQASYACEEGEILLGGMVESPLVTSSLGSWGIDNVNHEFDVNLSNREKSSTKGNVIYLCANIKS